MIGSVGHETKGITRAAIAVLNELPPKHRWIFVVIVIAAFAVVGVMSLRSAADARFRQGQCGNVTLSGSGNDTDLVNCSINEGATGPAR